MAIKNLFATNKKVLIIEDDVNLRVALKERLEERHFSVIETGDTQAVLYLVVSEEPAAIVLDLILPLQDGISLLEEIRAAGHTLPVIILSNLLGSGNLREDAQRLDATFYNKSSVSLDAIVDAVEKCIQ